MKKILSVFLAMLFCVFSVANIMPVASAENVGDNLIIHYDFEGQTEAEILSDKAKNGKSADDLKIDKSKKENGIEIGITLSDGCYSQKASSQTKGNRTFLRQKTNATADMKTVMEGDMTFISTFKLGADTISSDYNDTTTGSDGYVYLFDARGNNVRPFYVIFQRSTKKLLIGFAGQSAPNTAVATNIDLSSYDFNNAPWITLVVTIGKNSAGSWDMMTKYIVGNVSDAYMWKNGAFGNKLSGDSRATLNNNNAMLGNHNAAPGICIDDIKIYSKVLTSYEINSVTGMGKNVVRTPENSLIIHYDFEGNTEEEILSDKAVYGNTNDKLKIVNGAKDESGNYKGVEFSDGCVTQTDSVDLVYNKTRTYLQQNAVGTSDMIDAFEDDMTFVTRFRLTEEVLNYATNSNGADSNGYAFIFDARDFTISRAFSVFFVGKSKELKIGFAGSNVPKTDSAITIDLKNYDYKNAPWIELVITIDKNSGGAWDLRTFYTIGDVLSPIYRANDRNLTDRFAGETRAPVYATAAKTFNKDATPGLCIDDIKIYNIALTPKQYIKTGSKLDVTPVASTSAQLLLKGVQSTAIDVENSNFDIRLVSTLGIKYEELMQYNSIGFDVSMLYLNGDKLVDFSSTSKECKSSFVYQSINATVDGKNITYLASDFNAEFLSTLVIKDISAAGQITLTLTPFVYRNGVKEIGGYSYNFIYNNGVLSDAYVIAVND